jgi:uncharacterized membrane-anchored protein
MPRRAILWFAVAVALQVAIVGAIAIRGYATVRTGQLVRLHVEPVDPRDPFRGDYLTFDYDIERLSRDSFDQSPREGTVVYVPVARRGRYWEAEYGVSTTRPPQGRYPGSYVFLRAVVRSAPTSGDVIVDYGAGEIFIPEGSGSNFPANADVAVEAHVDEQGRLQPVRALVNGRPWP